MTNSREVDVSGTSMAPFILPGSRLSVEPVADVAALQVGDVVCFIDEGRAGVAHRIVRIGRDDGPCRVWVRGDAHRFEEEVPPEALVYVVRRVTFGPLAYRCQSPLGRHIARVAVGEHFSHRVAKAGWQALWKGAFRLWRMRP